MNNVGSVDRCGGAAQIKFKSEVTKQLQRISPGFKNAALVAEDSEFATDFIEGRSGLSETGEFQIIAF